MLFFMRVKPTEDMFYQQLILVFIRFKVNVIYGQKHFY